MISLETIYIIFDLEATCWTKKGDVDNGYPVSPYTNFDSGLDSLNAMEVIEIGAVALSVDENDNFKELGTYDAFVRPTLNPQLSEFCMALTSITQEEINKAEPIEVILPEFIEWARSFNGEAYFVSWGMFDKAIMERMKNKQNKNIDIKYFVKNHFSIKHRAANVGLFAKGTVKTLNKLGLSFDGFNHRGIDDAKNIAKIFKLYYQKAVKEYK